MKTIVCPRRTASTIVAAASLTFVTRKKLGYLILEIKTKFKMYLKVSTNQQNSMRLGYQLSVSSYSICLW